jgi:Domain of unknown function (DUF5069)
LKSRIVDPLDLTKHPPRSPRELLAGLDLLMAARTVDKLRATLPGGNLGDYQITGFSSRMLETIGIGEAALRAVIAGADSDEAVATWIRERSNAERRTAFNEMLAALTVGERLGDPDFVARYPIATRLPPETPRIDMLAADDREMFEV